MLIYDLSRALLILVLIVLIFKKAGLFTDLDYQSRNKNFDIFLASFLCLFLELTIIRYHASQVPLFAYFKNVSLFSCFLGLGIGFSLGAAKKIKLDNFVYLIVLQIFLLHLVGSEHIRQKTVNPISENMAMGLATGSVFNTYVYMGLMFVVNAITFVPLGQITSKLMSQKSPLPAYGINLAGSLSGIVAFSFVSYVSAPPIVWFYIGFIGILWFLRNERKKMYVTCLLIVGILGIENLGTIGANKKIIIYSPYQILASEFKETSDGLQKVEIAVNHDYFQNIFDLSFGHRKDKASPVARKLDQIAEYYEFPYRFKENPGRVLVVGSGTGNDVAAGIRKNAGIIDAVEIDPDVVWLGKIFHPESPYANPKVQLHVTDARTFMKSTRNKYDVIVYGLLDSHTLLSNLSNVRLDSFVYTVEAFKEARHLLKSDGIISLTFCLTHPLQGRKIFQMLEDAFDGQKPLCFLADYDFGVMYVIGPGLAKFTRSNLPAGLRNITSFFDVNNVRVDSATDDWPFFYMPLRVYPKSYLVMVAWLLLLSLCTILAFSKNLFRSFDWQFFLLGAGFMLIEAKGITELGLVFGNTWYVITFVIAAILVLAFSANYLVMKRNVNTKYFYWMLIGVILAEFSFKISRHYGILPYPIVPFYQLLILTAPLFFSGVVFSKELAKKGNIASVFSSNLLGAMFGGFLEYNSMFSGYHSLSGCALIIYIFAFLFFLFAKSRQQI